MGEDDMPRAACNSTRPSKCIMIVFQPKLDYCSHTHTHIYIYSIDRFSLLIFQIYTVTYIHRSIIFRPINGHKVKILSILKHLDIYIYTIHSRKRQIKNEANEITEKRHTFSINDQHDGCGGPNPQNEEKFRDVP